jgi:hypothetical protein
MKSRLDVLAFSPQSADFMCVMTLHFFPDSANEMLLGDNYSVHFECSFTVPLVKSEKVVGTKQTQAKKASRTTVYCRCT